MVFDDWYTSITIEHWEHKELMRRAWDAALGEACAEIKEADDKASEGDYMLDSDDCISVIRGTWRGDN